MDSGPPWRDPRRRYGFSGSGAGSGMRMPFQGRSDAAVAAAVAAASNNGGGGGGVLKRTLTEMERWQQRQQQQQQHMVLQQALFLRSVKQRTYMASPMSPLSPIDIGGGGASPSPSVFSGSNLAALTSPSSLSSLSSASRLVSTLPHQQGPSQRQVGFSLEQAEPAPGPAPPTKESFMRNQLEELERRLLDDDDEAEAVAAAASASGSAVTESEWGEMQQLISVASPPLPLANTPNNNTNNVMSSRSPSNSSSSTASSSASCSPPSAATTQSSRQLLSDAAAAIADSNLDAAGASLVALKRAANPRGDAEQRLMAMMAAALASRLGSAASHTIADLCGAEQRAATQLLHDNSPFFRLGLHSANLAIVDAVAGRRAVHIIDFDVTSSGVTQHAALIQSLAERGLGQFASLKLTAVTDPTSPFAAAAAAGFPVLCDRLKKVAHQAGVDFRFNAVSCRAADIKPASLGCEPDEALAVNLAFVLSRVPDESVSPANPRDELLRRVRALGPHVVTLVEQELSANTAPFAARFADACAHYGAILESLDATIHRDSPERARVEAALGRKAANAVAREGADRVERCEVHGKWRARFSMAGFRNVPISSAVAESVRARLGSTRPNHAGFTVKEENGGVGLAWMGRVVTIASAWR